MSLSKRLVVLLLVLPSVVWAIEPGSLWGLAPVGEPGGGDDVGPAIEIQAQRYKESGATLGWCGVSWGYALPEDPGDATPAYRFPGPEAFPFFLTGEGRYNIASIDLGCRWADPLKVQDPERYDRLATDFVQAAVKHFNNLGVFLFSAPGNEFNLLQRTDWAMAYVEPLRILYPAMKSVDPRNLLFAGNLSAGYESAIQALYDAGFGPLYDVMDIHCYSNHPRTGVSIEQVIITHQVMAKNGDGHKPIFLGEGYGPARSVPGIARTSPDQPVSDEELAALRAFVVNGYRNLTTPKPGFDPAWVLGARFFTLNDNMGGGGWAARATPVHDESGRLRHYVLDGYVLSSSEELTPRFYNGGLIDIEGNPKGDLIYNYPPALPKVVLRGWLERPGEDVAAVPEAQRTPQAAVAGRSERLRLLLHNTGEAPVQAGALRVAVKDREDVALRITPNVQDLVRDPRASGVFIQPVTSAGAATLTGGATQEYLYEVAFGNNLGGQTIVLLGEIDLVWNDKPYDWDCWIPVDVKPPVEVALASPRLLLVSEAPVAQATLSVVNHTASPVPLVLTVVCDNVVISASSSAVAPGQSVEAELVACATGPHVPGRVICPLVVSGATISVVVDRVADIVRAATRPVLDGQLEEWAVAATWPLGPPTTPDQGWQAPDGPEDLSASAQVMWDEHALYLAFRVTDDTFLQEQHGFDIWRGDSIQVAVDGLLDGVPGVEQRAYDDYEFGMALTGQGNVALRFYGPASGGPGIMQDAQVVLGRSGNLTIYEVAIPWTELVPIVPQPGTRFGLALLVNDSDGSGRTYCAWGGGIASGKCPGDHLPVRLLP